MKRLVSVGIVIAGLFFIVFATINTSVTKASSTDISAKEAFRLINENKGNESFIILDIRTPEEFSQGHIENAINIDYLSPDFKNKLAGLDKNKTYIMHCKSGGRSGKALTIFESLNFKNIIHMNAGFSEWAASNLPTVK